MDWFVTWNQKKTRNSAPANKNKTDRGQNVLPFGWGDWGPKWGMVENV